jgi:hypothetical protein
MSNPSDTPSCIPPQQFKRNEYGLICSPNVQYVYHDDGRVNWRKMIKPEFLVPHKDHFAKKGLPCPETTDGLTDDEMIILLGGLKDLADIRGYSSINFSLAAPTPEYVASICKITWIPNYETEGREITRAAQADAHPNNTKGFSSKYLAAIAENRAFCRAVRNFLKIQIVSADEIGEESGPSADDPATRLLREAMEKHGISFELVKQKLIADGKAEGADKFTSINDIPRVFQLELVERIKRKAAEQEALKTAAETV